MSYEPETSKTGCPWVDVTHGQVLLKEIDYNMAILKKTLIGLPQ